MTQNSLCCFLFCFDVCIVFVFFLPDINSEWLLTQIWNYAHPPRKISVLCLLVTNSHNLSIWTSLWFLRLGSVPAYMDLVIKKWRARERELWCKLSFPISKTTFFLGRNFPLFLGCFHGSFQIIKYSCKKYFEWC